MRGGVGPVRGRRLCVCAAAYVRVLCVCAAAYVRVLCVCGAGYVCARGCGGLAPHRMNGRPAGRHLARRTLLDSSFAAAAAAAPLRRPPPARPPPAAGARPAARPGGAGGGRLGVGRAMADAGGDGARAAAARVCGGRLVLTT